MSRIYTVSFAGTVTNAGGNADLFEVTPADDKPVKLRGFSLGNYSEFGDSAEEAVNISVMMLPATFTSSNGTATTPRPLDSADTAAGAACETNGATVATTTGTAITLAEYAWNLRASPYEVWYPDERFCPKVKGGEGMVVRLQSTLADDVSMACTFWIEEE
jgi:hypothetical protein